MNFVKRAGTSLGARRSRTAGLLGIFFVICVLLLGGFLLQGAAARQEADAQRAIGVDATVRKDGLSPALADRLGRSELVHRHNAEVPVRADADGFEPLVPDAPPPGGADRGAKGELGAVGVRDSGMLLPFSYGTMKVTDGRGITAADRGRHVALIERRLAERNGIEPGDTVRMRPAGGGRAIPLKVVGVFQDPSPPPTDWQPSYELPGNRLYVPVGTARQLGGDTASADDDDAAAEGNEGAGAPSVESAVYRIGSPELAEQLHAEAERLLGAGSFDFQVNDRAYRDQVRPIQRMGTFAGLLVWVIALAGALILGLIVMLQIRERRSELGVLLSMGERKWKLVGQHLVEMAALALPAVALAALAGSLAGQPVGDALLGPRSSGKGSAADTDRAAGREESDGGGGKPPAPGGGIAPPTVRVEPADVARVAGVGLGISLVSTVVPGVAILRLHPRSILTDTD
ncbi:ABC transporter permease [Streptomyces sp. XM4193]|uniref:ABC transporter permease n=1 Tax=Streptomyces sp. XM4193 TaxID=2929782 RepID=UPI001FF90925|nr:ABC transporter permease [Streptomyces sp. XM4193]MCK1796754.1 ABC transporter permease [Streptomyces sp. XM4193]